LQPTTPGRNAGWIVAATEVREGGEFQSTLAQNLAHTLARAIEKRLVIRARDEKPGLLGRSSWLACAERRLCAPPSKKPAAR